MNNKVLKIALKAELKVIVSTILFVVGSITSFLLSINISPYFYFLSIPLLALTVYLITLVYNNIKYTYNNEIKKEENLDDGLHKTYFDNNRRKLRYEFNILKGVKHGSYIEYFVNGHIKINANYENGKLDGFHKEYYEKGGLKYESNYSNGVQFGETKSYYDNGNVYRKFNLSNGEYEGEIKEFKKNGDLKFICNNDKYTFYKKNDIACEFEYDGKQPKGIWKNYRNDGTIEYELDFNLIKDNKVLKTVYTKGGVVYTKNYLGYEINHDLKYNIMGNHKHLFRFSPWQRMEYGKISIRAGAIGPPGFDGNIKVSIYPIESIEDIVELRN
jgi:antitoxin component YwqK of YwqJK toxin-antitoxin module